MSKGRLRWEGDRSLWIISLSLAVISLLSVYSASSHIAYLYGSGDIGKIVVKHLGFLVTGFGLMYVAHKFPYKRFGPLALLLLPLVAILLVVTLMQGQTINEANASRWLRVGGMSFQTSALAGLVLLVYVARFLSLNEPGSYTFKTSFIQLLLPVLLVCGLILPANLSTALMLFLLALLLMFVGRYPMGYMLRLIGTAVAGLALFILVVKAFPGISNRVDTWESRITGFFDGSAEEGYQVQKAKMAIAQGGLFGKGPGKSKLKHFLPQSNSDFIYAVIVEEYGFVGGAVVLLLYFILFFRILRIASRAPTLFGQLLVTAAGSGVMVQAFINMGVAVNVLPVTGQTLPLISAGGSSIWMSCLALGMILSVSRETKSSANETMPKNDEEEEGGSVHALSNA